MLALQIIDGMKDQHHGTAPLAMEGGEQTLHGFIGQALGYPHEKDGKFGSGEHLGRACFKRPGGVIMLDFEPELREMALRRHAEQGIAFQDQQIQARQAVLIRLARNGKARQDFFPLLARMGGHLQIHRDH